MSRHAAPSETHLTDAKFHLGLAKKSLSRAADGAQDEAMFEVADRLGRLVDDAIAQARTGLLSTDRRSR